MPRFTLAVTLALAIGAVGCLSTPVHVVDIAAPGHVVATLSGQVGATVQGEAQLAVGIAPHTQIEGSGMVAVTGSSGALGGGGGVRVDMPLTSAENQEPARVSLQIAGLYAHAALPAYDCNSDTSPACLPASEYDAGSLELGIVVREPRPRAFAFGVWLAGGPQFVRSSWISGPSIFAQAALRASVEAPIDDARHFYVLAGATLSYSSAPNLQPFSWIVGVGGGIEARF